MTTEQLQELEEKAKLWDSLGKSFLTMLGFQLKQHKDVVFDSKPIAAPFHNGNQNTNGTTTIQNTSNASTFIDVLKEEFNEGLCSCNFKKCECLTQ